eukprot:COSAG02_NODE_1424_length_12684_cov_13.471116_11_plen_52_part_00
MRTFVPSRPTWALRRFQQRRFMPSLIYQCCMNEKAGGAEKGAAGAVRRRRR